MPSAGVHAGAPQCRTPEQKRFVEIKPVGPTGCLTPENLTNILLQGRTGMVGSTVRLLEIYSGVIVPKIIRNW